MEYNWSEEFDKQFNHDNPSGRAIFILIDNSDGSRSQAPAQDMIKEFINHTIQIEKDKYTKEMDKIRELNTIFLDRLALKSLNDTIKWQESYLKERDIWVQ